MNHATPLFPAVARALGALVLVAVLAVPVSLRLGAASRAGAAGAGTASIAVTAPSAAQQVGDRFIAMASLAAFTPGSAATWGGYQVELAFDRSVLRATVISASACDSAANSAYRLGSGYAASMCWGQASSATAVLDTIVLECLAPGTTALHIVPYLSPDRVYAGTELVDTTGEQRFSLTLQDTSVTCADYIDDDLDGCPNTGEPALGTDPANPWDFFSVPVPALISAPDPRLAFRDRFVSASDPQAVMAYFKAGAHTGAAVYEQDLNGNGMKDGVEYDRSTAVPPRSGPPDGTVSAGDAQLAFAQFKAGFAC